MHFHIHMQQHFEDMFADVTRGICVGVLRFCIYDLFTFYLRLRTFEFTVLSPELLPDFSRFIFCCFVLFTVYLRLRAFESTVLFVAIEAKINTQDPWHALLGPTFVVRYGSSLVDWVGRSRARAGPTQSISEDLQEQILNSEMKTQNARFKGIYCGDC